MAKSQRKVPALNASSMADISFLLLTFFLLGSNMDVDSGLARRLPPPPQTEEDTSVEVQRRNLLVVLVNAQNETMVRVVCQRSGITRSRRESSTERQGERICSEHLQ